MSNQSKIRSILKPFTSYPIEGELSISARQSKKKARIYSEIQEGSEESHSSTKRIRDNEQPINDDISQCEDVFDMTKLKNLASAIA